MFRIARVEVVKVSLKPSKCHSKVLDDFNICIPLTMIELVSYIFVHAI